MKNTHLSTSDSIIGHNQTTIVSCKIQEQQFKFRSVEKTIIAASCSIPNISGSSCVIFVSEDLFDHRPKPSIGVVWYGKNGDI